MRRWIEAEPGGTDGLLALDVVADLPVLLRALREVDPAGGPAPGLHSGWRGAGPDQRDAESRRAVRDQHDRLDGAASLAVWRRARDADAGTGAVAGAAAGAAGPAASAVPRWFHGDVAPGNLLLRDGRLAAVIDFGLAGVGDPACDLAVAWTACDADSRADLRRLTGVDEADLAARAGLGAVEGADRPGRPAPRGPVGPGALGLVDPGARSATGVGARRAQM